MSGVFSTCHVSTVGSPVALSACRLVGTVGRTKSLSRVGPHSPHLLTCQLRTRLTVFGTQVP
eukprot:6612054-Prymnesium_polylepis.1